MSRPYRPSTGTEGADFMASFCDHCQRDAEFQVTQEAEDGCPIVAATMGCGTHDDPEYPAEWIYGTDGLPTCTAFEPEEWPNIIVDRRQGELFQHA
jgi:hypothetical protein